jgi:predicted transcriptional regulator
VTKLLTKATPALLVADAGAVQGIVTRGDLLQFLMTR